MKTFQKLQRFPLGSIYAEGFLKEQLQISKDGIAGHLYELEPGMIADPYIDKKYVEAWGAGAHDQAGWGGEISGNYWTGYIQTAFTLNDQEMISRATEWVNTMMTKQREDGYLGTYYDEEDHMLEDYNGWGVSCAMRGLIAFYEATGREEVLKAVYRCMLWFCEHWSGKRKTRYAGAALIEIMILVYQLVGDEKLIAFAKEYAEFLCEDDIFHISYQSMLTDEQVYNTNHAAGAVYMMRMPAVLYSATGEKKYLQATERRVKMIREKSVQLSGGPVCNVEYLGPVSSIGETEYCALAFANASYASMSYITGEAKYGDYMEELFYNGVQGARKKDEKAIAYLTAPNQIFATEGSSIFGPRGDMQVYAPCYPVSCCPVNAVVVLPEFVRGMFLHDAQDNIYAVAYGPCTLNYRDIVIEEKTQYPFRNRVVFEVQCEKTFALNLKIPQWCKGYSVTVNGQKVFAEQNEDGFVSVHREWKPEDLVEITFQAEIEVIKVDDSDASGKHPIAVKYGVLLFSYGIPERWTPVKGSPMTALPEGWDWYDVTPDYDALAVDDCTESIGATRKRISWNIALDEKLSEKDFCIEEVEGEGYAWSHPMIKLHTHCYKAPYLYPNYPKKTYEPYEEYQYVTERLPLTLVPYGCTNLRITYFPKAKLE